MLTRLLLALISSYQRWLSPLTGDRCRFEPSCSRYAALCVRYHGPRRGSWLSLRRLVRCNPLCAGGIDLPPLPPHASAADKQVNWDRLSRRVEAQAGITNVKNPLSLRPQLAPIVTARTRNGAHRS